MCKYIKLSFINNNYIFVYERLLSLCVVTYLESDLYNDMIINTMHSTKGSLFVKFY